MSALEETVVTSAAVVTPTAGTEAAVAAPPQPPTSIPLTPKLPLLPPANDGLDPSIVNADGATKLIVSCPTSTCTMRRVPPCVTASEAITDTWKEADGTH